MSEFQIDDTEENRRAIQFMTELLVVLGRHGLAGDEESEVNPERAANVLLTEVHDWYRTGKIATDATSFAEYCEQAQEANYVVDDLRDEFTA